MNDTNPQIEEQLNKLADIVCGSLEGSEPVASDDYELLLKSLLMSGFARKKEMSLQVEIENRVKDKCREPSMHRGGELSGLTKQLQQKFDKLVRWESRQPDDKSDPKAANISSASDA